MNINKKLYKVFLKTKYGGIKKMKKAHKKILGGLIVVTLLATIGAVVVSASPGFLSDLTDEQKEELRALRQELRDEGATCEEIREAMHEQLESYGIDLPTQDEMLDKQINQTRQRLEILERKKELREEGFECGVFVPIALIGLEKISHFFGPNKSTSDLAFQVIVYKSEVNN